MLAVLLAGCPTMALGRAPRGPPPLLRIPLRVQVARCPEQGGEGPLQPVHSEVWVKAQVLAANLVLAPQRVQLDSTYELFTPERCDLVGAGQRDALARHVEMDGRVTVLVMRRVQDLDVPQYDLMGVHWRYGGRDGAARGRRWIFLTGRSFPPVLAHELCHYFGLPHDPRGGNLMTPGPSDPAWKRRDRPARFSPVLNAAQGRRLRRGAAALKGVKRAIGSPK